MGRYELIACLVEKTRQSESATTDYSERGFGLFADAFTIGLPKPHTKPFLCRGHL